MFPHHQGIKGNFSHPLMTDALALQNFSSLLAATTFRKIK